MIMLTHVMFQGLRNYFGCEVLPGDIPSGGRGLRMSKGLSDPVVHCCKNPWKHLPEADYSLATHFSQGR